MASHLIRQIAIVSESSAVPQDLAARIGAAIQKQVTRDLAPIWEVSATVDTFAKLEDVPLGTWPILIQDNIDYAGAAGIHLDNDGQPFALVEANQDEDVVSLTTSHESIEMLVDPFGKRLVAGDSPKPDQGRVLFLVEPCDPSEDARYAYSVNGVLVSDFYTPEFFDPIAAAGVRYSFSGAIQEPRDVLDGGYLSWMLPESREWWQEVWFGTPHSEFVSRGAMDDCNMRSALDKHTQRGRTQSMAAGRYVARLAGTAARRVSLATSARAHDLRTAIERVKKESGLPRAGANGNGGTGNGGGALVAAVGAAPAPARTSGAHRRCAPRL
ncbi:MAG TPA: hypothetical protein VMR86_17640 [Myxococcota bacterium]|nr:hypothetical protein [Myxococcota bacterium]